MDACICLKESSLAALRVCENLPVIGHAIGFMYHCCMHDKDRRQRAMLKATAGFFCFLCNCPAETCDEIVRKRPQQLKPKILTQTNADWMAGVDANKTLLELSLPASHQSGSYRMTKTLRKLPLLEGWSRCQELDISKQLEAGVRFFDLRVMLHNNDIWLHHNVVTCIPLREVLESVKKFLQAHKQEIAFLFITNDGKEADWAMCSNLIQEYFKNHLIPESMKTSTIGELTSMSKNVVVLGLPEADYAWKAFKYRWPNMAKPTELAKDMRETAASEICSGARDFLFWYKAECTPDAAMVTRSIGGAPGAAMFPRVEFKFEFLKDMAQVTNAHILKALDDFDWPPFNVISTDYVHEDVIEQIIEFNHMSTAPGVARTSSGPVVIERQPTETDPLVSYTANNEPLNGAAGDMETASYMPWPEGGPPSQSDPTKTAV